MEQFIYLDEAAMDRYNEPHENCRYQKPAQVNFQTFTKRSFPNECPNQIYVMKDWKLPNPNTLAENDKYIIRSILDTVLAPPKLTPYFAAIESVKRRLFYSTIKTVRKMAQPKQKQSVTIECEYFKPQRHILGVRKLRRNLIAEELKEVHNERLYRERILANERILEASESSAALKALKALLL